MTIIAIEILVIITNFTTTIPPRFPPHSTYSKTKTKSVTNSPSQRNILITVSLSDSNGHPGTPEATTHTRKRNTKTRWLEGVMVICYKIHLLPGRKKKKTKI